MHLVLERVLTPAEVDRVRARTSVGTFTDGSETSDVAAKRNLQLAGSDPAAREEASFVIDRLAAHPRFARAVYPSAIIAPMFSRYEPGMVYPAHVDNALIDGRRADVSLTLFLSDPSEYDGGDLVVSTSGGERRHRPPAGDAVVYPSTSLHCVEPVSRGRREAFVCWVQSMVRDPERRAILSDLGSLADELPAGPYGDRVRRSFVNLERMWLES